MSEITLNAEIRTAVGKKAQALRREGMVPGIYYGHGKSNITVALSEIALKPLYSTTATHVINLKLSDGSSHVCILRDVQFDPVTERPIHFDLFGLNENEELTIEVPVKLLGGTPKGVKDGGILQHVMHRVEVSCLPRYIPDHIEVNVENLEMNRSVHVRDLSIPNVTILANENNTIVAVVPPVVVKEAETAAATTTGETPAEPEVIAKGKKVEEGAEEGAAKPEKGEKGEKAEKAEKK